MEEKGQLVTNKIEKKLKRREFNLFDAAIACVMFIVLQILFDLVYQFLPSSFTNTFTVAFLASLLVESIFFFTVIITAKQRNVEFVSATKLNVKPDILSVLLAFGISFICLVSFTGLTNVFVNFLYKLGYSSNASLAVPNLLVYLIYIFLICICPAFFEDFLFRGCILSGLRKLGDNKAVILSALIFMLMHGGPDQTIHQFIIGIVLGYSFLASGTIWIPVIIHFANNFTALTLAYLTRNAETVETVIPTWGQLFLQLASAVISAIIGVYLVYFCIRGLKKIKENKEKETLNNKMQEAKNNEETITQEVAEEISIQESKLEIKEETLTETLSTDNQNIKENKYTKILFGLAGAYLLINWLLALISGLI